ncbi:hypothetical protein [Terribacillus saccharophilus]|uniref:hypothetical protein n=1 Tax=Terribacillus saccharophilus TaxID=361277 RepID=UPI002989F9C5|nr:hypothetical protein [Terribacillus saccharophilus]MCM3225961.1 hypothetical protein [Terribacillus saccharophilus]
MILIRAYISWFIVFIGAIFISLTGAFFLLCAFKWVGINSEAVVIGLIGYTGSIIGGLLTLVGVYLTIKSTNKSKEVDAIPEKIHRLETAIEQAKMVYELTKKYIKDNSDDNIILLTFEENSISPSNTLNELIRKHINGIKIHLIYVDSDSYKRLLKAKAELEYIKQREILNLNLDIPDKIYSPMPDGMGGFEHAEPKFKLEAKQSNDRMLGSILGVYRELVNVLEVKHEKFMVKMSD